MEQARRQETLSVPKEYRVPKKEADQSRRKAVSLGAEIVSDFVIRTGFF